MSSLLWCRWAVHVLFLYYNLQQNHCCTHHSLIKKINVVNYWICGSRLGGASESDNYSLDIINVPVFNFLVIFVTSSYKPSTAVLWLYLTKPWPFVGKRLPKKIQILPELSCDYANVVLKSCYFEVFKCSLAAKKITFIQNCANLTLRLIMVSETFFRAHP